MKTEDINFIGSDPGAVKYGNFINYYSFHTAKQRTDNLNPQMFPAFVSDGPLLCLDIGCNSGELTKELNMYLKTYIYPNCEIRFLAIDIDSTLIKRAQESYGDTDISFVSTNIMDPADREHCEIYLDSYGKKAFDLTFCFSVTMWIHLNNGDEGLLEFLKFTKDISKTIIMEPQPWNCYRNAQRRVKKSGSSFPLYENLKIRNNVNLVIETILTENTHRKVYESPTLTWKRKIQSYQISVL